MASRKDPSQRSGRLIAAETLTGTTVYKHAGEKLGSIEEIMLDKFTGKNCSAVLSFGISGSSC